MQYRTSGVVEVGTRRRATLSSEGDAFSTMVFLKCNHLRVTYNHILHFDCEISKLCTDANTRGYFF